MTKNAVQGVRARVRAELTAEIKAAATRQLVEQGAAALSLRAISRELGMASSAIYRYFASRDELLTALLIDAYNELGQVAETADGALPRTDLGARFVAIATSVRGWAVDNPHYWALLYGSPVPGYIAPNDTAGPASRVTVALISILVEAGEKDRRIDSKLAAALDGLIDNTANTVSAPRLSEGLEAWGAIVGLISLELFGHFGTVVSKPEVMFRHNAEAMAARILESSGAS